MFRNDISARQKNILMIGALSAPLSTLAGMDGWLQTLLGAVVVGTLACFCCRLQEKLEEPGKGYRIVQILWLIFLLGQLGKWPSHTWPNGTDFPVVPLTLLALGAFSSLDGGSCAARCATALFWLLLILYGVILFSGLSAWELKNLAPEPGMVSWELLLVMLLPAAVGILPGEKAGIRGIAGTALTAAVLSLWTIGTLTRGVAEQVPWPLYESVKGMNLFGVAERYEAFVSVAATMGYFILLSLLFSGIGTLGDGISGLGGKKSVAWAGVISGALVLYVPHLPGELLFFGGIVFWLVLPAFALFIKKSKKRKNCKKELDKG